MLLGFCEHLVDGEEGFGQYLPELLNKLYAIVMTSTNQLAREKTIFAISSIVITCRNNFAEVMLDPHPDQKNSKFIINVNLIIGSWKRDDYL